MPRIEPSATGCEANGLPTVLCGPCSIQKFSYFVGMGSNIDFEGLLEVKALKTVKGQNKF